MRLQILTDNHNLNKFIKIFFMFNPCHDKICNNRKRFHCSIGFASGDYANCGFVLLFENRRCKSHAFNASVDCFEKYFDRKMAGCPAVKIGA